jgi:hypothetical protein
MKNPIVQLTGAAMTKPSKMTSLALAGGLAGIAAGLLSCSSWKANNAFDSLQIVQVQTVTGTGSDCVVSATPSTAGRTVGTLDVYLPDGSYPPYILPLLIANNLDSVGGSKATEMNNITLNKFSVTLSAPGMSWPESCPATFDSESFTIVLQPSGSTGYPVPIIRAQHAQCLLAKLAPQTGQAPQHILVKASVVAKGGHGGTAIESAPFVYNVDVCTGCLQEDYSDPSLLAYNYPAGYPACNALSGGNPYPGDPCFAPGQDVRILCCGYTDNDGRQRAACPAVPTGKSGTDTSTSTTTTP